MKNLIISILSMQIITGLSFWEFSDKLDRVCVGVALTIVLWVAIEALDEWIVAMRRKRKMQRARARRFAIDVIDLTNEKEVG